MHGRGWKIDLIDQTQGKTMPDHFEIYRSQAEKYDLMVSKADYNGNLLSTLQNIVPLESSTVAEFGAGTGRLTRLLAPIVKHIYAFDRSQHMLDVANQKLQSNGFTNWQTAVADHRKVDLADEAADLAISAWSVCYLVQRNDDCWQIEVPKALAEMERVLRPGGTIILIETLGTGETHPNPPKHLIPYYDYLIENGFQHTAIRTDCKFNDLEEAEMLTRFFFPQEMVGKIKLTDAGVILPECTGIWWRS